MLSNGLAARLKPYRKLTNKANTAPVYQALQLSPGLVRGCNPSMILETHCDHGLEETIYVNADVFLSVLNSLPDNEEVELSTADGILHWKCGTAKGKIGTVAIEEMPQISGEAPPVAKPKGRRRITNQTEQLIEALIFGGLSAGARSSQLLSMGLYGVVIDNRGDNTAIYSSDNTTVSFVEMDQKFTMEPELVTISPKTVELLDELVMPSGLVRIVENSLFYRDEFCQLQAQHVAPLRSDINEVCRQFAGAEQTAKIPPDAIMVFIKRATALAEDRRSTTIGLSIAENALQLDFEESLSSTQETYTLADLTEGEEITPVKLDGLKLVRALEHADTLVLDYLTRGAIVLRGTEPEFRYIISGKTE